jgi:hypothetical protein
MRLPLIPPSELTPQQKSLYDEMRKGIASNFYAFKVKDNDIQLTNQAIVAETFLPIAFGQTRST